MSFKPRPKNHELIGTLINRLSEARAVVAEVQALIDEHPERAFVAGATGGNVPMPTRKPSAPKGTGAKRGKAPKIPDQEIIDAMKALGATKTKGVGIKDIGTKAGKTLTSARMQGLKGTGAIKSNGKRRGGLWLLS